MAGIITLRQPIWGGGSPKFGIADYKLTGQSVIVECLYKNKAGDRSFPGRYQILCSKAKSFPTQRVAGGVRLHVIPVEEFVAIG